jgi:rhamnosyltransferase
LAYVAEAEVVHVHDETMGQVYNRYRREAIALKRMRPHDHFRFADFIRLYLSNVASDWVHARRQGRWASTWREILWFRLMQFWGTYRGFAYRGPVDQRLIQVFYYPRGLRGSGRPAERQVAPIDYGLRSDEGAEE